MSDDGAGNASLGARGRHTRTPRQVLPEIRIARMAHPAPAALAALLALSVGVPTAATAQDTPAPAPPTPAVDLPPRPKVGFFNRERENWTLLQHTEDRKSLDGLKYIPLNDDGDIALSFGASSRARYEVFENFAFRPENDDDYVLTHLRVHADLRIGDNIRFFAEGQTAWITERDLPGQVRAIDEDQIDLTAVAC